MKKVRLDIPDLLYGAGTTLTILTASHILPISWSGLCTYWLLSLVYGGAALLTSGIIDEVKRNDDK